MCEVQAEVTATESVNEEKDLGIIASEDLKWEKHCSAAVSKTNRIEYD